MYHFISYARNDGSKFAQNLYCKLVSCTPKINVWMDEYDLKPGIDWDVQIEEAIKSCHTFLYVITADSVLPDSVCKDEWTLAIRYRKPIIPLVVDESIEIPFRLENRQYIKLCDNRDDGFSKLIDYLKNFNDNIEILNDNKNQNNRILPGIFRKRPFLVYLSEIIGISSISIAILMLKSLSYLEMIVLIMLVILVFISYNYLRPWNGGNKNVISRSMFLTMVISIIAILILLFLGSIPFFERFEKKGDIVRKSTNKDIIIRGVIRDMSNNPIFDAKISIDSYDFSARSNEDGVFIAKLKNVLWEDSNDIITIRVYHNKYKSASKTEIMKPEMDFMFKLERR